MYFQIIQGCILLKYVCEIFERLGVSSFLCITDLWVVCGKRYFKNSVRSMSRTMTMNVLHWAFAQQKEICKISAMAVTKMITPYKQHILRLINTTLVSASGVRVPFCIEWPWWEHWNGDVCVHVRRCVWLNLWLAVNTSYKEITTLAVPCFLTLSLLLYSFIHPGDIQKNIFIFVVINVVSFKIIKENIYEICPHTFLFEDQIQELLMSEERLILN